MYLGVNSLRFHSKSIPMGIMSHGGICLPVTPVYQKHLGRAIWSLEHFWEEKVQKGQDVFFTMSVTMCPASSRQ